MANRLVIYGTFCDKCAARLCMVSGQISKVNTDEHEIGIDDKCWGCDSKLREL